MLDTVEINHVQHISFAQSRLTDAVSVILSELLSYEHPPNPTGGFSYPKAAGFFHQIICFFFKIPNAAAISTNAMVTGNQKFAKGK